jgi:hypothetical protein
MEPGAISMLVLTRRPKQGDHSIILIGDDVIVEVIGAEHGAVRIGISAPPNVKIDGGPDNPSVKVKMRNRQRDADPSALAGSENE